MTIVTTVTTTTILSKYRPLQWLRIIGHIFDVVRPLCLLEVTAGNYTLSQYGGHRGM